MYKRQVKDLLEENNHETIGLKTGLTEVKVTIADKDYKTLIDTGSEISVIAENVLGELRETNKIFQYYQ